jgi:hypothetical protein
MRAAPATASRPGAADICNDPVATALRPACRIRSMSCARGSHAKFAQAGVDYAAILAF